MLEEPPARMAPLLIRGRFSAGQNGISAHLPVVLRQQDPVWGRTQPAVREPVGLGSCPAPVGLSCQALASTEDNMVFGGFTDGRIRIWDLRSRGVVRCGHRLEHSELRT